jgi:glyoxylase-like metal-dependent hydrolase (beta-lactamase superfamily II)
LGLNRFDTAAYQESVMMSTATLSQSALDGSVCRPRVDAFFERRTCSIQYVVSDPASRSCALIDPVLDYDEKSGAVATVSADALLAFVREHDLTVEWILDTHPHADHFSAADYLKRLTGAKTAIGEQVVDVQQLWKNIYNLSDFKADGSQWDRLMADGDVFQIGTMDVKVLFSPGHTLASITYVVGDAAFVHDTLLMPDFGTARCDFPGGDAKAMWRTIQRILSLPDETRLFVGHDYMPGGRAPTWESTVASQKARNVHLQQARNEDEFVSLRCARDAKLPMPKLILSALQVNMAGGRLPAPESNGVRYLKIPLDALPNPVWD